MLGGEAVGAQPQGGIVNNDDLMDRFVVAIMLILIVSVAAGWLG